MPDRHTPTCLLYIKAVVHGGYFPLRQLFNNTVNHWDSFLIRQLSIETVVIGVGSWWKQLLIETVDERGSPSDVVPRKL